jgi:ribosomal protein S18 acetylase RimI-like enzyme
MIDISALSRRYAVRRLHETDAEDVLDLCRGNAQYYDYCGAEPTMEQVLSDLRVTPPGVGPADKYYVGFYEGGHLVAVLDLIDGYPDPDTGFIGFFMVDASVQKQEVGSGIIRDVCAYLKETGKRRVRLAMAEDNPQAKHFWKKNGFLVVSRAAMDGWTALVAAKTL